MDELLERMNNLRGRLREIRNKLDLSQGKFAERMGIKQNTWSNIEKGVNPCSDRYIKLVCLTFNVHEEWLRNGLGGMFESSFPKSPPELIIGNDGKTLPPNVTEIITIYQELVPLNQEAVLTFAETILQSQRNTIRAFEQAPESTTKQPETPQETEDGGRRTNTSEISA
jgi:transcriptional regulator with XRE-family HTH domain